MKSEPLHSILEKIRKPLDFAARDGFAGLRTLAGVQRLMEALIRDLRSQGVREEACAGLSRAFAGFDDLPEEDRKARIAEALSVLEGLAQADKGKAGEKISPFPRKPDVPAGTGAPPGLSDPIQYCKGVGPRRAELLKKLGVETVEDALLFLPWRYEDRGNLKKIGMVSFGVYETVSGEVLSAEVVETKRRRVKIFELVITDRTGILVGSWFNQAHMKKSFKVGQRVLLSGVVKSNAYRGGRPQMDNPDFEVLDEEEGDSLLIHTGRIVPIYRATAGLTARQIRSIMKGIVDSCAPSVPEVLPPEVVRKYGLMSARKALVDVHFPEQTADLALLNQGRSAGHRRLIFEELFVLETGLSIRKRGVAEEKKGIAFRPADRLEAELRSRLPFRLTAAQERVVREIKRDMESGHPMNRLVQGDVGCGKTVVALLASLLAVENGCQACLMAPTEILAEQHFRNIADIAGSLRVTVCILTGGLRKKEKDRVIRQIASGEANIVIGTHSLIEQEVRFSRLGLAIIDEQHRFGVMQRSTLTDKGYRPDVLVMTATPIPRTLALTVYGDLDVSVIDEMPPGRNPVITRLYFESRRREAYALVEEELRKGRQAYVVYPLVEETEKSDLKAATEMAAHLQRDIFPDWQVGLLHGRMKRQEKEEVMSAFKAGALPLLVSTTVIEVGVDVQNATVMAIEHPERFGLAQLHQLRGRVGRGSHQSWCLLMGPRMFTEETRERLNAFVRTSDGFRIAEEDLRIRGPGEFFGTRQSGLPDLRAANLIRDADLLETVRQEAFALTREDPDLARHPDLRQLVRRRWEGKLGLVTVS